MLWFLMAMAGPLAYAITCHLDRFLLDKYFDAGGVGTRTDLERRIEQDLARFVCDQLDRADQPNAARFADQRVVRHFAEALHKAR